MNAVLIPLQLILAMIGMGATLELSSFRELVRRPKALVFALGLQWLGVPLLAAFFIAAFGLSPGWAVGLVIVASVPGGATSNLATFIGRGDVPLSIATTLVSTLGCIVTIPLILQVFAAEHLPADFALPRVAILQDIALYLLLPLVGGMVLRRAKKGAADVASRWAIRGSILCLGVIAVVALGTGEIKLESYGVLPPARILLFAMVLAFGTPHLVRALGFADPVATALGIEVGVRNVAIGLLLIRFFFPGEDASGQVLFTCLFYSGASFPFCLPNLWRSRRGLSPAIGRAPRPAPETAP